MVDNRIQSFPVSACQSVTDTPSIGIHALMISGLNGLTRLHRDLIFYFNKMRMAKHAWSMRWVKNMETKHGMTWTRNLTTWHPFREVVIYMAFQIQEVNIHEVVMDWIKYSLWNNEGSL